MTGNPGGIHTRWPRLNGARHAAVDRCRRCGDLRPGVSVNSTLNCHRYATNPTRDTGEPVALDEKRSALRCGKRERAYQRADVTPGQRANASATSGALSQRRANEAIRDFVSSPDMWSPQQATRRHLDPSPCDGDSGDGDPHHLHMDLDQGCTVKLRAAGADSGIGCRGADCVPARRGRVSTTRSSTSTSVPVTRSPRKSVHALDPADRPVWAAGTAPFQRQGVWPLAEDQRS
jgi:hypothetical protein